MAGSLVMVDLEGSGLLLTNLAAYSAGIEAQQQVMLKTLADQLRDKMIEFAAESEWTGLLIRDLEENGVREVGIGVFEVGPTLPYAPYVEYGTLPHAPPMDAITPWADDHGITPGQLYSKIKSYGTAAEPFVVPAAIAMEGKLAGEDLASLLALSALMGI